MPALKLFEVFVRFEVKGHTQEEAEDVVDDFLAELQKPTSKVKMPTKIGEFAIDSDQSAEVED